MNISCIGMSTSVAGDVGTCNLIVLEGGFSDRSDSPAKRYVTVSAALMGRTNFAARRRC